MWLHWLAWAALSWYLFILLVISIGLVQLYRYFSRPVPASVSAHLPLEQVPHVTVIRPIVGVDPYLYECLAATFRQHYPASRLTVHFCIPTRDDPARPVVQRLLRDFPDRDARLFIAEDDPVLQRVTEDGGQNGNNEGRNDDGDGGALGPNPKIRNMSRAYREAKGDIVWIIDCNVWVGPSVAGLMVDRLCAFGDASGGRKYKFAHQLPLAVDVSDLPGSALASTSDLLPPQPPPPASSSSFSSTSPAAPLIDHASEQHRKRSLWSLLPSGNRLEEMFLSSSHAKFYTAISTVAIAPCTVGKSNMFRRSHLDALTPPDRALHPRRSHGIDFFSENICEDHLISDILWRSTVPREVAEAAEREGQPPTTTEQESAAAGPSGGRRRKWGNHALVVAPPCIQPLAGLSAAGYAARRSRWLRVRKFTVPSATAVEPGTESFLATAYAAWALTTLPRFTAAAATDEINHPWSIVPPTWTAFVVIWLTGVAAWCVKDWLVWGMLQSWQAEGFGDGGGGGGDDGGGAGGEGGAGAAAAAPFVGHGIRRRARHGFWPWFAAWLGREAMAFPIWAWAILGGVTVVWRGKRFWVGLDMKVHEVKDRDDNDDDGGGRGGRGGDSSISSNGGGSADDTANGDGARRRKHFRE